MCNSILKTPAKFANIHLISKQIAIKMQLMPSFLPDAAFLFTTDYSLPKLNPSLNS